jgi:ABC-2 type transport system ATP-binding protein
MAAAESVVRVRELRKKYGAAEALAGVSLDVARGETVGLIGPDGAGKTTLMRIVCGLLLADSGSASVLEYDCHIHHRQIKEYLGYMPQRFSLYPDLTVAENIRFFADLFGVSSADLAERRRRLMEFSGLGPFLGRRAGHLSGGMKQKLALVCTLVHTPELLVLDEPTTGVDPVSRRDFWKLLARLQREGLTLLLTTPYLDEAERCTRVALVDHGRLLTVEAPDALRAAEPGVMVEVVAEPRRQAITLLREAPGVAEVEVFGERLHASLPDEAPARAAEVASRLAARLREAGLDVRSARPATPSLEDVFIGRIRARESAASEVNP